MTKAILQTKKHISKKVEHGFDYGQVFDYQKEKIRKWIGLKNVDMQPATYDHSIQTVGH